ncbi:DUF5709 domain-containing protein [Pseudonocardia lacus]|uniref:DUF5709 domain-containing protein n=1 Tax=Pseudonocardia lacus TaxID=2835865 RepID=UPI001BDC6C3F|nr:DUF5709 domain-containing protein [Pseudonocardia lacus]
MIGDEDTSPDVTEDDGLLDPSDTLLDRDQLDEGYSPPERPYAVDGWGTTAAEEAAGESLGARLRREVPEDAQADGDGLGDTTDTDGELLDREVGDRRSGRLAEGGEELFSTDVGIDGGAASAEEAAVHLVPDEDGDSDPDSGDAAAEFLRGR